MANVTEAHIGDLIEWTITVINHGPDEADDVFVVENLPDSLEYVSHVDDEGIFDKNTMVWTIGNIANGESAVLKLVTRVVLSNVAIVNSAVVNSSTYDPNDDNNNGSNIDNKIESDSVADLEVIKVANATSVKVGDLIEWTITVINHGPDMARDVKVAENLPESLALVTYYTADGIFNKNTLVWSIGNIENGATVVLTLITRVTMSHVDIVNSAVASSSTYDPNTTNNNGSNINNTVESEPITDLSINQTTDNATYNVGDEIIVTIVVSNDYEHMAHNVTVKVEFDESLKVISADKDFNNGIWVIGNLDKDKTIALVLTLKATKEGTYTIVSNVSSTVMDANEDNNIATSTIIVSKVSDYPVDITTNVTPDGNVTIEVTVPEDATGNVTVTIGNETYTAPIENGTAVINVTDVTPGDYTVDVNITGDDKYDGTTEPVSFKVNSIGTVIIVERDFTRISTDFNAGERGDYFYAILKDEFGNILVNKTVQIAVNGPIYTVRTDEQGRAAIMINLRVATSYTYALFFQGDEKYNATYIGSARLTVTKKDTFLTASNQAFKSSDKNKIVKATLSTIENPFDGKVYMRSNLPVTLTINGKTYNARTDEKGNVKFNIGDQTKKGTYDAVIKYAGDQGYESVSKTIRITIGDSTSTSGTTTSKSSSTPYTPNNGTYRSTDEGTPTGNNVPTKKNTYIEVEEEFTRVATDYNAGERGDYFYAVLKDSDGNPLANKMVQIAVNGPIYTVKTDSQGRAAIMINLASANTYTYALVFSGDDEYNAAPLACSKLVVTKKPITIDAKDVTFKSTDKTKTVFVTLKTSKNLYDGKTYIKSGKKVTLTVDGKTYNGYIDSSGNVKFNIGALTKKGTFNGVIKFAGDQTYEAASEKVKITVK